jgi:hypothetical protein
MVSPFSTWIVDLHIKRLLNIPESWSALLPRLLEAWGEFTNCTKFLIGNSDIFLLAPLSGILHLAFPLNLNDIIDNSRAIHQFF